MTSNRWVPRRRPDLARQGVSEDTGSPGILPAFGVDERGQVLTVTSGGTIAWLNAPGQTHEVQLWQPGVYYDAGHIVIVDPALKGGLSTDPWEIWLAQTTIPPSTDPPGVSLDHDWKPLGSPGLVTDPPFDKTKGYHEGELVWFDSNTYRALKEIPTPIPPAELPTPDIDITNWSLVQQPSSAALNILPPVKSQTELSAVDTTNTPDGSLIVVEGDHTLYQWLDLGGGFGWRAKGVIGTKGADGKDGVDGKDGAPGTPGGPGPKGDPGAGIEIKASVATEGDLPATAPQGEGHLVTGGAKAGHLFFFENGAWVDAGKITGPTGLRGQKGDEGDRGPKGDPGAAGTKGDKGDPGQDGTDGKDGTSVAITGSVETEADLPQPGVDGEGHLVRTGAKAGHLFIHTAGAWVDAGLIAGPAGQPGANGQKGDKGDKGDPGQDGADGKDGTSIEIQGSVASHSDLPTTGNPGEGHITRDTGNLWFWENGTWTNAGAIRGPRGLKGDDGTDGSDGDDGRGIVSTSVGTDRHVVLHYSDNTTDDIGRFDGKGIYGLTQATPPTPAEIQASGWETGDVAIWFKPLTEADLDDLAETNQQALTALTARVTALEAGP